MTERRNKNLSRKKSSRNIKKRTARIARVMGQINAKREPKKPA